MTEKRQKGNLQNDKNVLHIDLKDDFTYVNILKSYHIVHLRVMHLTRCYTLTKNRHNYKQKEAQVILKNNSLNEHQ